MELMRNIEDLHFFKNTQKIDTDTMIDSLRDDTFILLKEKRQNWFCFFLR